MFRLIEVKYSLTFYNLWVNFVLCVTTSLSDLWSSSLCSMLAPRITRRTTVFCAPTSWPVTSVTSFVLSVLYTVSCSSVCGSWTAIRPNNLGVFFLASKEGSVSQSFISCDTTLTHSSSLVVSSVLLGPSWCYVHLNRLWLPPFRCTYTCHLIILRQTTSTENTQQYLPHVTT
jgi:hypothetical protein